MSDKTDAKALAAVLSLCALFLLYFGVRDQAAILVAFAMLTLLVSMRMK